MSVVLCLGISVSSCTMLFWLFHCGVIHKGRPQWRREGGSSQMRTKVDKGKGGFQWKRTSALSHVGIWFKESIGSSQQPAFSNRAGQTDIGLTDTSCITAPALRQSWAISAETADEWDEIPLPYHDSTSVALADGQHCICSIPRVQVQTSAGGGEGLGQCGQKRTRGRVGQFWLIFCGRPLWMTPVTFTVVIVIHSTLQSGRC